MLARVAESLYWIGRNIERCEHCSRFLKVQFFSTLDAPMAQNKDFTLRSILFMSGSDFGTEAILNENEVWKKVIFDLNNPNSILRLATNARENARSIRNTISMELWESINKWYLYCKTLDRNTFSSADIFSFTENIKTSIALVKSDINNTLLHNDVWRFICLGVYIERGLQVLRILNSKISDCTILSDNGANVPLLRFQWIILLKSLEAFDVHRQVNQQQLTRASIFKLILTNMMFPRSLGYTVHQVIELFNGISVRPPAYEEVRNEIDQTLVTCFHFEQFTDEEKIISGIGDAYNCISQFHNKFEELYFQ